MPLADPFYGIAEGPLRKPMSRAVTCPGEDVPDLPAAIHASLANIDAAFNRLETHRAVLK